MSHWFDDLAHESATRGISRRQTIDGGAKAIALGALMSGPLAALTAAPAVAETYCLTNCQMDAGDTLSRRAHTCDLNDHVDPDKTKNVFELMLEGGRLACTAVAYAVYRNAEDECHKPNCGDATTYPRPPVDDCANCESVGGICCGVTTDPDGHVRIAACNNPTRPCGT